MTREFDKWTLKIPLASYQRKLRRGATESPRDQALIRGTKAIENFYQSALMKLRYNAECAVHVRYLLSDPHDLLNFESPISSLERPIDLLGQRHAVILSKTVASTKTLGSLVHGEWTSMLFAPTVMLSPRGMEARPYSWIYSGEAPTDSEIDLLTKRALIGTVL